MTIQERLARWAMAKAYRNGGRTAIRANMPRALKAFDKLPVLAGIMNTMLSLMGGSPEKEEVVSNKATDLFIEMADVYFEYEK